MHWSFLLILVYGAFIFSQRAGSLVIGALYGVLVMLLLFLCVTLHEFGHAVVARHYHIKVPSITLLPIGGVANLERMPDRPSQELAIAIAGPLVNIVIALLLLPVAAFSIGGLGFGGGLPTPRMLASNMMTPGFTNLIIYLLSTNILLVIFNLLPAFPMDGGRVLRALLAMAMPYVRATRIAVYVGRIMALIFAVVGIAGGGIFLLLIAFFVYVGGSAELENVTNRSVLRNIDVGRALRPQQMTLFTSDRLNRAVTLLMTSHQSVYAV
ncbi:MAG: site-2 protease family protein, partial [Caldilineaceae bacterium]|nr:site-2 protease family protein [Caldilineaceae bacterium]